MILGLWGLSVLVGFELVHCYAVRERNLRNAFCGLDPCLWYDSS